MMNVRSGLNDTSTEFFLFSKTAVLNLGRDYYLEIIVKYFFSLQCGACWAECCATIIEAFERCLARQRVCRVDTTIVYRKLNDDLNEDGLEMDG